MNKFFTFVGIILGLYCWFVKGLFKKTKSESPPEKVKMGNNVFVLEPGCDDVLETIKVDYYLDFGPEEEKCPTRM